VTKITAEEPTKRLSLDLPASVHTRFKTTCSATGRKMVGELQMLIEQRASELEQEAVRAGADLGYINREPTTRLKPGRKRKETQGQVTIPGPKRVVDEFVRFV
jgi:hypothetical protein